MQTVWYLSLGALALVISGFAQAQQALPRECRQEIVKICGTDRSAIRACLRENSSELSETCRSNLRDRMHTARSERRGNSREAVRQNLAAQPSAAQELSFGSDRLQRADFWAGAKPDAPLVVFVHGGGWKRGDKRVMTDSAKLSHWQAQGYAVASTNYRLVPDATVEQQAADIAASVAYFRTLAATLGIDADRIVVIGHSAGAHLVALVGTDPAYFAAVGLAMDNIAGVVALDGAGYLVPEQMNENGRVLGDTYTQAFGTDQARQLQLSPSNHTAGPNAPAFLILHVERADAERQSLGLARGLNGHGTPAKVIGIEGRGLRGHRDINQKLGEADYPATPLVDAFLKELFAQ